MKVIHVFERNPVTNEVGLLFGTYSTMQVAINHLISFCTTMNDRPRFGNRHFTITESVVDDGTPEAKDEIIAQGTNMTHFLGRYDWNMYTKTLDFAGF